MDSAQLTDEPSASSLKQSLGYLANQMARLMTRSLAQELKPLGLAPAQFVVLMQLWERDGLTQGELVARLNVEQATMANTLNRMERDGFVERRQHPRDSRAQTLHMTEKASGMREAAMRTARRVNEAVVGDLSDEERATLIHLMQRVIQTIARV